jgi:2-keto-4-pentenoate hydratase
MRRSLAALLIALVPLPAAADCPPVPEVARLAAAILDRRPDPPPQAALSPTDAICARDLLVAMLAQPWGDQVGWKVAPSAPPRAGAMLHATLRLRAGETFAAGTTPLLPARFGTMAVTLSDGEREVARGGTMGAHPLDALAWLVRDLAARGRRLRAGEHAAIAGLTPAVAAVPTTYRARFTGLGARPLTVDVRLQ